jgi:LacI family transcriptional regulator
MTFRKVALLIETAGSYGRGLLRGIGEYSRMRGPWILSLRPRPPLSRFDGILALVRGRAQARRLRSARVPVVDLDYALPDFAPWGVSNDERAVAELAARHLRERGLDRFAFCGWPTPTLWETERRRCFARAVGRRRLHVHPPRRDLARWLRSLPKPCGLLAANDERGRHVLEAARSAGIRVPEELAVLGVDDDEVLCEVAVPPLSSIQLDTRRIGFEGAAALDRLMRGRRPRRRPLLAAPLGVVARPSTDVLAIPDPPVAAAARFLRANVHRPIRVPDLVRAAGISRRALEIRFRLALGRSPHEEILRARLERVRDLLVRTDWPLKRISRDCGFTYPEQLHAAFRRRFRTTPGRYRAERKRGAPPRGEAPR